MKRKTLVYLMIEWDDSKTRAPGKWDWNELVAAGGDGEQVTDYGSTSCPMGLDNREMMERVAEVSHDIAEEAVLFEEEPASSARNLESDDDDNDL